ncbi:MAG: SPOR domain-containing protein [Pseudomonadota bacterium]
MDRARAKTDKAVVRAELAVQQAPEAVAARTLLGRAYLAAGRFDSAATALSDAVTLGDTSGSTALALALSHIGQGRFNSAVAVLEGARTELPAGDLGLALALAGDTSRGVAVLTDALRRGENSAKLRQNLAYAFALDGRWQDARVMAAQDVPADQLDQRLAIWALSTLPDRNGERLAGLLGAPVRQDSGQPAALALRSEPAAPLLAAAAASVPADVELPVLAVAAMPPAAVVAMQALQMERLPAAPARAAQPPRSATVAFRSDARVPMTRVVRPQPIQPVRDISDGRAHYVQLGSFGSEQGARRAWSIYTRQNPSLAAYRMTITPAVVRGQSVWRVAAGGVVSGPAAGGLCASVKARGGACFAYAAPIKARSVPTPQFGTSSAQMARRR